MQDNTTVEQKITLTQEDEDIILSKPVTQWPSPLKTEFFKLCAELHDLFSIRILEDWVMKSRVTTLPPGQRKGDLFPPSPDITVETWLKINGNNHPQRLHLFWCVIQDQESTADVLAAIDASPIGVVFKKDRIRIKK
jgi:hypothetical protein